ncbi:hypothetical protein GGTG_14374 [Gaeumannomyces tritici R3-111a-1]|uniref:Uncharacterized protein n=1 Tax=Gaeumannomyces tritici (strain R3-111a-1) TaxID=644352 RepID=J3PLB5_GAET3|nr:hypothetical protein GGTG_14374 [Gaeumannomyces tritici R3-111a-1]EJT68047.1 hypothetical protein GGTG_14374 [Gaeumannomyces tritici R3-111a-1]
MPVPHDRAGRVKRVRALPEKSVLDDVLYLGTVKRHHALPQNGDDDVVYLGTVNRGHALEEAVCVGSSTVQNTAGGRPADQRTKARARTSSNRGPSRPKRPSHGGAISTPHPLRNRRRSNAPYRKTRIPPRIVDGLVKLGWSRRLDRGWQEVYGSFSRTGRFCYWLDTAKSDPIAQKDVQYVTRFGGMTAQQVKAEVYRILEAASRDIGVV